mmetsp:Transcript_139739/g.243344  ORF Transcript_139739/g.243344 Transcript_139739/m.243344 type:complete len:304 (+) Transcript_139739:2-913(+)
MAMAELAEVANAGVHRQPETGDGATRDGNVEQSPSKPNNACFSKERCRRNILPNILLFCIFVACFSLAVWATVTGHMEDGVKSIADLHYAIVFSIIIVLMLFVNLPCGWGYSVVVTSTGFGLGWKGLPAVLIGGVILGPCLAWFVTRQIILKDATPESLISKVPHKRSRRWIHAIVTGLQEDRCSICIVAATRPSPLVSGWQNLVLSVASPPFWSCYVVGTIIGGSPDATLYTYIGILLRQATDEANRNSNTVRMVTYIVQVVACVLFIALISCAARRRLAKYQRNEEGEPRNGESPCNVTSV